MNNCEILDVIIGDNDFCGFPNNITDEEKRKLRNDTPNLIEKWYKIKMDKARQNYINSQLLDSFDSQKLHELAVRKYF